MAGASKHGVYRLLSPVRSHTHPYETDGAPLPTGKVHTCAKARKREQGLGGARATGPCHSLYNPLAETRRLHGYNIETLRGGMTKWRERRRRTQKRNPAPRRRRPANERADLITPRVCSTRIRAVMNILRVGALLQANAYPGVRDSVRKGDTAPAMTPFFTDGTRPRVSALRDYFCERSSNERRRKWTR